MRKKSAGILLYRFSNGKLQVLLVHPGGPFWAKKDLGAWGIPKGEVDETENAADAAKRELKEETGITVTGELRELEPVKQSNKIIYAWAVHQDADPANIKSNEFEMEWPPHSGRKQSFPEIDMAEWLTVEQAKIKIIKGQIPLIEELESITAAVGVG
jgi:predicted NUDIX family NTP pyrophosphohydrolase